MTNHPSRNWRAIMRAECNKFVDSDEGRCLIEIPIRPESFAEAMEKRIRRAFDAGYKARKGRE